MHCLGAHSTNTVSIEFQIQLYRYVHIFHWNCAHTYMCKTSLRSNQSLLNLGISWNLDFTGNVLSGMGDGRFWSAIRRIFHGHLARYVKLRIAHAPGMPRTFSPPLRVSDSDMHQGTCVTHVLWCMPGSLTSGFLWIRWRRRGKTFPAFPAHAQPAILLIR